MKQTKQAAKKTIEEHYSQDNLDSVKTKKIKRLAASHRIRLGPLRKRTCKYCGHDLKHSSVRITNTYKTTICANCGKHLRWNLKASEEK